MQIYQEYIDLLLRYNRTHRLSGLKTVEAVWEYIEDSLYPRSFIDFGSLKRVLDIGTGAGFPGMVLAIAFREVHFTLVEPLQKRVAFLHLIKSTYDLQNVTILQSRIEDTEPFCADLITSRAVTDTAQLLSLADAFICPDTEVLFYKGSSVKDELKDADFSYEIIERGVRKYLYIKGFKR